MYIVSAIILGLCCIFFYLGLRKWPKRLEHFTYASLVEKFDKQDIESFYNAICKLSKRQDPPLARSAFFQAHQFMVKHNSAYSLLFYLHYLNVKTSTAKFRHRKVNEEHRKILFRNKMQETKFLQICSRLKENKNLIQAIEETKLLFPVSRRNIQLDESIIEEINREHSQTAELLGKYLEDEILITPEIPVPIAVMPENSLENGLFRLFEQNNFTLNKKEIDTFARNNGLFCESLIQQINETYYETLDDVLIEDKSENYILNETYYEQIKQ